MTDHTISTPEGPLAYCLLGEGPPRVALLMGWGLNTAFLRRTAAWPVLETWAAAQPLLLLDRRGTGGSRANQGDAAPEQTAADLAAALDDAKAGPVCVWAHADAALAALPLAAREPERVTRLVLQAPFARLLAGPDQPEGMSLEAMLSLAMLDPAAPVMRELDALGAAPGAEGDGPARLRPTIAAGLLPRLFNDVAAVDARPVLGSVRVPVLVVHGSEDRVIPPSSAALVARMLPAARLESIAGMGHLPAPEHLRELLARVDAFLRAQP
jgi:pimeloyl-ACP methyl ester carboxylesterase